MNEADTRARLIDPKLAESGWGTADGAGILREYRITNGKKGGGSKPLIADYILYYNGVKLAVVEAKSDECEVGEGVGQAKDYALKMRLPFAYATNGKEIYFINMLTGKEAAVERFLSPLEMWNTAFAKKNEWLDKFNSVPFESINGTREPRYYQEAAVNSVMKAVAGKKERILLTLATGTGKTFIAFQVAWKLFQTRWNLSRDGKRRPRILFLADRNILADQAYLDFMAFPADALIRIKPDEIKKKGKVPVNGNIFFTIFQTFMSGTGADGKPAPYFGDYPPDYFDFVIVDECHRGGANDESRWRGILEYFQPAVQLGLTATPKRDVNIDTYKYFGEPVYVYSLKEGIEDGFLTPFKIKRVSTTLDEYVYAPDDDVLEGTVEEGKIYEEKDFNKKIEIKEREKKRVSIYLNEADQNEKAIVFCANQDHALVIRDLINQLKKNPDPLYCVRVTANDGKLGDEYLGKFRDNEKTIPTILTTSQKLSTGVDARNIRNIVLMRQINSMVEFKQIIGRGTRLFEGKEFFTIYDYVKAYHHFNDPAWDGEPEEIIDENSGEENNDILKDSLNCPVCGKYPCVCPKDKPELCPECGQYPCKCPKKIKIKLGSGKERDIQYMIGTLYIGADGKPVSAVEFVHEIYGKLPSLFTSEEELRKIWSLPGTRRALLEKLADAGYGKEALDNLRAMVNAGKSDLFDVLRHIAFSAKPLSREERVESARNDIYKNLNKAQKEFVDFVLSRYVQSGEEQLDDQESLPALLKIKYHEIDDAVKALGKVERIRQTFLKFQPYLYNNPAA